MIFSGMLGGLRALLIAEGFRGAGMGNAECATRGRNGFRLARSKCPEEGVVFPRLFTICGTVALLTPAGDPTRKLGSATAVNTRPMSSGVPL